jgi:predicted Rossmann fold nucleotide-binding protein DprA/Smf involved in DNA uptake
VELITNHVSDVEPATHMNEADHLEILALLRRRPCTTQDIAQGLGMNASDVNKRLLFLDRRGNISAIRRHGVVFYETVESEKRTS